MRLCRRKVTTATLLLFCCFLFKGCFLQTLQEKSYYANRNNYIQTSGTVNYYRYTEDGTELYISFTNIPEGCEYLSFKISDEELATARNNRIDEHVTIGSEIIFVTAPKMFGDGYCPPIIGLQCDGIIIIPSQYFANGK